MGSKLRLESITCRNDNATEKFFLVQSFSKFEISSIFRILKIQTKKRKVLVFGCTWLVNIIDVIALSCFRCSEIGIIPSVHPGRRRPTFYLNSRSTAMGGFYIVTGLSHMPQDHFRPHPDFPKTHDNTNDVQTSAN